MIGTESWNQNESLGTIYSGNRGDIICLVTVTGSNLTGADSKVVFQNSNVMDTVWSISFSSFQE